MNYNSELIEVIEVLNSLDVPYMVTGSIATNLHGIPRLSQDADFVVQVASGKGIREIVAKLGERYKLDPQATFESITGSLRYRLQANETGYKIELFLLMDEKPSFICVYPRASAANFFRSKYLRVLRASVFLSLRNSVVETIFHLLYKTRLPCAAFRNRSNR